MADTKKMQKWVPSKYLEYGLKEETYEWTQTPWDVLVQFKVAEGVRGKDICVDIAPQHLKIVVTEGGAKKTIVDGDLARPVVVDDSTWVKDGPAVEVTLRKCGASQGEDADKWWPSCIAGAATVDCKALEGSKYLDESLLKRLWEEKHGKNGADLATTKLKTEVTE